MIHMHNYSTMIEFLKKNVALPHTEYFSLSFITNIFSTSIKMQCFKCLNLFQTPTELFSHLEIVHKVPNKYGFVCMLCDDVSKEIGRYKKHVQVCFPKYDMEDEAVRNKRDQVRQANNDIAMEDINLSEFRDAIKKSALDFACTMSATMTIPRSFVFEITSKCQKTVVNTIVSGTIILNKNIYFYLLSFITLYC